MPDGTADDTKNSQDAGRRRLAVRPIYQHAGIAWRCLRFLATQIATQVIRDWLD
jgi:hypothetical protein